MLSTYTVLILADALFFLLSVSIIFLGNLSNPGHGSGAFGAGFLMLGGAIGVFLSVVFGLLVGFAYFVSWPLALVFFIGVLIALTLFFKPR